ncbi:MAG TPA: hypothetical protein VFV02_00760 [Acidimicrobiales bacterium]|nr:hypothetical protein [Acidimicrobiales bacterium]
MAKGRTVPPIDEAASIPQGLTREEDDELRRLHRFSQLGELAGRKRERLMELRLRDRRKEIRPLRSFGEEEIHVASGPTRKWFRFRTR